MSAALLLMLSTILSGVLGLIRQKCINSIFGAGLETDAYNAAFQLPDQLAYFLVGGVASITLITILNRYRARGDEAGADRALSAVLNAMIAVLGLGIVLAEPLASVYTHIFFRGFQPAQAALSTSLTRIMLPAQLFFLIGGVVGSRLLVRRIFLYQAVQPLIYNLGIICGAIFLHRRFGIYSLAIGVLAGIMVSAAFTLFGALRDGFHYQPILNLRHPAFLEWLRLTFPLMIGVSLVAADKWILSYFASNDTGAISRLMVAKTLFNAPMSLLGQAAGAASLPFFAALYSQRRFGDFASAVNSAVSRVLGAALLMGAWMIALASPIVDLFRGGSFTPADAHATVVYFTVFTLSIAFWSSQGIYARSFYAAGNTVTPAIVGWTVTLISLPVYSLLFHAAGVTGLTWASNIGMLVQTLALAVLLNRSGMVRFSGLDAGELGRALLAACVSLAGAYATMRTLHLPRTHTHDAVLIVAGTAVWALLSVAVLWLTRSSWLRQMRAKL